MPGPGRRPTVVIGVGNEFRRDDGAGPAVIGQLRGLVPSGVELVITDGEPTRLIEAWTGAALAVVVDAVRVSGPQPHPGQVHRFAVDRPGTAASQAASSHGFGLDDAIALAAALDRMPARLIVHAIEAADLTQGTGLTPAVAAAVDVVARAILDDVGASRLVTKVIAVKKLSERAWQVIAAASMTVGRGPLARAAADAAELTPADRVVDIGCGPGTAVRHAARLAASATGIDPDPVMLRLAHWGTALRGSPNVSWLEGGAEKLPLADGQATVAWAINSVHHWEDRDAGIGEAWRILAPGGRLVLVERLAKPGARGHAAHGLTRDQADDLTRQLAAVGFDQVRPHIAKAGQRSVVIIRSAKAPVA